MSSQKYLRIFTNYCRYLHWKKLGRSKVEEFACEKPPTRYTSSMFFFPLINFIFLIILYVVHKKVFWITLVLEIGIYAGGIFYIYENF